MNDRSMPAPRGPASTRSADDAGSSAGSGSVITLTCTVDDVESLSEVAWAHGASGIAELTDGCDRGSARLVVGADDAGAAALLAAALGDDRRCVIESVTAADDRWPDAWRAHATPHRAGPFGIRLADHPPTDAPFDLVIEPGLTFGYGHPTTLLALELLAGIGRPLGRVLDLGSGSGVLAIAASLLGADEVTAVDIDPDAVATSQANAGRNGAIVAVACADACSDPLPSPAVGYDLVVVNVTAAVQIALADVVASVTGPDPIVVVSGILAHQASAVVAAHGSVTVTDRLDRDGWVAFVLQGGGDLSARSTGGRGGPESDPPGP